MHGPRPTRRRSQLQRRGQMVAPHAVGRVRREADGQPGRVGCFGQGASQIVRIRRRQARAADQLDEAHLADGLLAQHAHIQAAARDIAHARHARTQRPPHAFANARGFQRRGLRPAAQRHQGLEPRPERLRREAPRIARQLQVGVRVDQSGQQHDLPEIVQRIACFSAYGRRRPDLRDPPADDAHGAAAQRRAADRGHPRGPENQPVLL